MKICIWGRRGSYHRHSGNPAYPGSQSDVGHSPERGSLFHGFDDHGGSVRQDFSHALHDLGRVVARTNNCIAA